MHNDGKPLPVGNASLGILAEWFCNNGSSLLIKYKAPAGKFSVRAVVGYICRGGGVLLPALVVAVNAFIFLHGVWEFRINSVFHITTAHNGKAQGT